MDTVSNGEGENSVKVIETLEMLLFCASIGYPPADQNCRNVPRNKWFCHEK